ncbi:hypothetical protein D3C76_1762820 [compost metagenome]
MVALLDFLMDPLADQLAHGDGVGGKVQGEIIEDFARDRLVADGERCHGNSFSGKRQNG